jgi:hypothetical protein
MKNRIHTDAHALPTAKWKVNSRLPAPNVFRPEEQLQVRFYTLPLKPYAPRAESD